MNRLIPILIIVLTYSASGLSQNKILDKPWVNKIRYFNSGLYYNYSNSMFALKEPAQPTRVNYNFLVRIFEIFLKTANTK